MPFSTIPTRAQALARTIQDHGQAFGAPHFGRSMAEAVSLSLPTHADPTEEDVEASFDNIRTLPPIDSAHQAIAFRASLQRMEDAGTDLILGARALVPHLRAVGHTLKVEISSRWGKCQRYLMVDRETFDMDNADSISRIDAHLAILARLPIPDAHERHRPYRFDDGITVVAATVAQAILVRTLLRAPEQLVETPDMGTRRMDDVRACFRNARDFYETLCLSDRISS